MRSMLAPTGVLTERKSAAEKRAAKYLASFDDLLTAFNENPNARTYTVLEVSLLGYLEAKELAANSRYYIEKKEEAR